MSRQQGGAATAGNGHGGGQCIEGQGWCGARQPQAAVRAGVSTTGHGDAGRASKSSGGGEQGSVERAAAFEVAQDAAGHRHIAHHKAAAWGFAELEADERRLPTAQGAHVAADAECGPHGGDGEGHAVVGVVAIGIGIAGRVRKRATGHADATGCAAVGFGGEGGGVDRSIAGKVAQRAAAGHHIGCGEVAGRLAQGEGDGGRVASAQRSACGHVAGDGHGGTHRVDRDGQRIAGGSVVVARQVSECTGRQLDAASGGAAVGGRESAGVNQA